MLIIKILIFNFSRCPFSRKIAPIWVLVGNSLKSSKVQVAEVECIKNKVICEQQNVFSYPTIKMFRNGIDAGTFDSDKFDVNLENLIEFGNSFVEKESGKNLVPNQKSFGKCLG